MGNFGKRVLIVLLCALAIVGLALVGNAYEQAERVHKVSNQKNVIYSGNYNNLSYDLTKADIWDTMINSSLISTVEDLMNKHLLKSLIESITDENEINAKIEYLTYGTNDATELEKIKGDNETNEKYLDSFKQQMKVLGLSSDGTITDKVKDYAKYLLAQEKYALSRIEDGKTIGGHEIDLSDDALTDEWESKYKDTYAIVLKFLSTEDAKSFIIREGNNLVQVSSEIRYYIGNQKWKGEKVNGSLAVDDDLVIIPLTQEVEMSDGTKQTLNVPNANVKTTTVDGVTTYVWNSKFDAWECATSTTDTLYLINADYNGDKDYWEYYKKATYTNETDSETGEETKVENVVADTDITYIVDSTAKKYEDITSFTTDNTARLNDSQFLRFYISFYNELYYKQGKQMPEPLTAQALIEKFGSAEDANAKLKDLGFWANEGEIRKYVGNDEYQVELDDNGKGKGIDGYAVYKKNGTKDVPNYEVEAELDADGNFVYVKDADGNKKSLMVEIADATFTNANTIEASFAQLYSIYASFFPEDFEDAKYVYDDVNTNRADVAKQIFQTLAFNKQASSYLKDVTSLNSNYYLIFKLTDSTMTEATEEDLASLKDEKIAEYAKDATLVSMALADLRGEAGLKLYDKFLTIDYETVIKYDSTNNKYGVENEKDYKKYYKAKGYNAKKLAALTKEVTVGGTKVSKLTITADDIYEYLMDTAPATYLVATALNKVLLAMPEFEKLHGKETNYLTSKNWLMKNYAETTQYYNYMFESYKQMYQQYGIEYYDSVSEFLYAYGAKSFDNMVLQLQRSTMKNIFNYNALVGELTSTELSEYGKSVTLDNTEFTNCVSDYIDVNVNHLLIYVDLNEDDQPDDYQEFYAAIEDGTTDLVITLEEYETLLDDLYDALVKFIAEDGSLSATSTTALSTFVTKYKDSSRIDGDYAKFKEYGLCVKYESLGEVTAASINNYVSEFKEAVLSLTEKLDRVDKDLLGYTTLDGLCETEFGLHYIVEAPAKNYDVPSFKVEDGTGYAEGVVNTSDEISATQLALYIQQKYYTNIFGNTDSPEEKAKESGYNDFYYPNLPAELVNNIELVYGTVLDVVTDASANYNSTYVMLKSMTNCETYKESINDLLSIYQEAIFGEEN